MRILTTAAPTLIKASGIRTTKIVAVWPITQHIEGRREVWEMDQCPPTEIDCAYTTSGDYVGDLKFAKYLAGRAIRPEKVDASHTVCSIGYSEPDQAWYGWSHRACVAFRIGDRVFEPEYGDDQTLFTQHGSKEIVSLEDARTAAVAFARYVS